jgi:hypothetical protein
MSEFIDYLSTIGDRIFAAHNKNSIEDFKQVYDEVLNYDYPDKETMYDKEFTLAEVNRLNVLKTFLVFTKNYPNEECLAMRKIVLEEHYKPLADKFGIKHY